MSYLDEYNNNVSLKILIEFLRDYINTDKENDSIKFAKSLIDESDLENINKVIEEVIQNNMKHNIFRFKILISFLSL